MLRFKFSLRKPSRNILRSLISLFKKSKSSLERVRQRVANRPTTWGRGLWAGTAIAGKTILCVMDTMVTRVQVSSNDVSDNKTPTPRGDTPETWLRSITRELRHCSSGKARPTGLPPVLCGSITHYPPFCSPHSRCSGLLGVLLHPGPFPVSALPGMPFLDRHQCGPFRCPFSPLLKQRACSASSSLPKITTSASALPSALSTIRHITYFVVCLH